MKIKELLFLVSTLMATTSMAQFDRQMFSINPQIKLKGPVYNTLGRRDYNSRVFRIIIEEAHKSGKEYLDYDDHFAYWTFITGALTVPKHEGSNLHFKKVDDSSKCLDKSNKVSPFSSSQKSTNDVFNRVFRSGPVVAIPNCSEFQGYDFFYQMLHGHDGTDIGIMQVNIRWHEKNYLSIGSWKNVRESVRYGLSLYKRGFESVYRSPDKYTCIKNSNGTINPYNLIRSAWAGVYNSGNASKSCRYTNKDDAWKKNDQNFEKSLNKIIGLSEKGNRNIEYAMNDTEDAVIGAIANNFRTNNSNNTFLTYFINNPNISVSDLAATDPALLAVMPEEEQEDNDIDTNLVGPIKPDTTPSILFVNQIEMDQVVTAQNLFVRTEPGTFGKKCGLMPRGFEIKTIGVTPSGWYRIKITSELKARYSKAKGYSYNDCINDESIFTSGKYLAQKAPVIADIIQSAVEENNEVEENKPVIAETDDTFKDDNVTSEVKVLRKAIILSPGAVLRQGMPSGYTMAPKTGEVLFPNEEVQYVEKLYNSSKSKHPWYQIVHPHKGWVYGQLVKEVN